MTKTNVRGYSDKELLDKVKSLPSFKGIPEDYWILGVQSNEDAYNSFDDKFYLFYGEEFITVAQGTTNAGSTGLKNYDKYNSKGFAVIKTNEWYHNLWQFGYHKGKMPALKQVNPILFYRDGNKNTKVEEHGPVFSDIIGINFHTVSYRKDKDIEKQLINGWSLGCQVINNVGKYYEILHLVDGQDKVSYCLLKEF